MLEQMSRHQEVDQEVSEVRDQLGLAERERNHAFEELREIKLKLSRISGENNAELNSFKKCLDDANKELKLKDKTIESLRSEVDKVNRLESKLAEKDAELQAAKEQVSHSEATVSQREGLLSDSKKKMEELEAEVNRRKESEVKLHDSYVSQTNQLQEASHSLDKFRAEAASLREKVLEMEKERQQKDETAKEDIKRLRDEVVLERENSARIKDGDKSAKIETKTLSNENDFLKKELKRAMEAEETSKKALDDLALVLKEVAEESNHAKEKLSSTLQQLEAVTEETSHLKKMVKSTEGTYEAHLKELKKENDRLTNTVNRLRLEAEESLLAWSGKEIEFVKCIKKSDDEKNAVQEVNNKLMISLKEAEELNEKSKEEAKKLRDILKQALNEANAAKEAANLARDENSYLKDALEEKDKALLSLAQETERLRINEAEANESIKELKRVLTTGSKKEVAKLEKESKEHKKMAKKEKDTTADHVEKEPTRERRLSGTFSFDLNQLWPPIPGLTHKSSKEVEEDPDKDDALGGSIFDLVESPEKEHPTYHRRTSSACSSTDDGCTLNFDGFDEDEHFDDMEIERTSHGKRKALLRRFGDLLRRKNSHHPPKDLPHPPKEVAHAPKEISA